MNKYLIKIPLILILFSCQTFPGKRALTLIYMNQRNCGFFQFYRDGSLRYLLGDRMQENCADNKIMPAPQLGDIGKYSFDEKTSLTPHLSLMPSHKGTFEIRFEEDMKTLYLKRKNAIDEERFERMK